MAANWDSIADVVVVGSGCAGAVTAIAAREEGADVLVVEKQPKDSHVSSTGMSGGGLLLPGDDSAVKYLGGLSRVSGGLSWVSEDIIRVFVKYGMGVNAWIEAHGGRVRDEHAVGENTEVSGHDAFGHYNFLGNGYGLQRFLDGQVATKKIPVSYGTQALELITDTTGRVVGVEVETDNGDGKKRTRIGASRGVVLACGGFEYNETMKLNYLRVHPTYFTGTPSATGDGIKMALAVGADLWHMNCVSGRLVAKFPEFPIAFDPSFDSLRVRGRPNPAKIDPAKRPGYVIVDRDGKRFTNEDFKPHCLYYELTLFDTHRMVYPRVPSYWVFDRRRIEIESLFSLRTGATGPFRLYEWDRDSSKELEKGWVVTGKTIRELARKIGLSPERLDRTIKTYNRYCAKGRDSEFGRGSRSLVPLDKPPFFAMELWPGGPNTQGGPRKNARAQVLNVNGEPIPGLYSAGEMGSIFGMLYPGGGSNLAECFAMGRVAGENVAHEGRK